MKEGGSTLDREDALKIARDFLEEPIWHFTEQLERTLKGLAHVEHFDVNDSTAVGAAIHSAIPQAFKAAKLSEFGMSIEYCRIGPCYKISATIPFGKSKREICIEPHVAGPQGGTSKTKHQFATSDIEGAPELPGFATEAPESLLFFLAYHLDAAKVSVNKLFLTFADGVDRRKVRLYRPAAEASHKSVVPTVPNKGPTGSKLKIKEKVRREADEHDGKTNKPGDASASS